MLKQLFDEGHKEMMEDNEIVFLQIVDEMYLIGLLQLDEQKVT